MAGRFIATIGSAQDATDAQAAPLTLDLGELDGFATLVVYGTFSVTYAIEISPDGGTTWITARDRNGNALSGKTAADMYDLSLRTVLLRINATWTSGTLNAVLNTGK